MKLTSYSDFALRALIYLAVKPTQGELANIDDIAKSYNISKSHLTKIVHQLGKLGYIDSVRGKGGGIRLAKEPSQINIGTLIRHTENDFAILDCLLDGTADVNKIDVVNIKDDGNGCVISPVCGLKGVFYEAMLAFVQTLDRYTLDDVIKNRDELLDVL